MIFGIQYLLLGAGFGPFNYVLGNYIVEYTRASSTLLGIFFIIHPITYLCKPLICAIADRYAAHKLILMICCLGCVALYTPFIVIPFYLQTQEEKSSLFRFWMYSALHVLGSICFDGSRSLADALTMNYISRIRTDYGRYRLFGILSFGICGLLIGYINTGTFLPDYVAGMMIFVACYAALLLISFGWPAEYYVMLSESQLQDRNYMEKRPTLMGNKECLKHVCKKLCCCLTTSHPNDCDDNNSSNDQCERGTAYKTGTNKSRKYLNVVQQLRIMNQLIQLDLRVPLLMITLFLSGAVGYSGQHFVQVQLKQVCSNGDCNSSVISGYIMIGICIGELLVLAFTSRFQIHYYATIQISLVSTCLQYFALYYLTKFSPDFYVIAGVHGIEAFIILLVCLKQGRQFANRVENIIPLLRHKNIITAENDIELVKISLAATMIATMVLCHEGLGPVLGRLVLGVIIDKYGFDCAWLSIVVSSLILLLILVGAKKIGERTSLSSKLIRFEDTKDRQSI